MDIYKTGEDIKLHIHNLVMNMQNIGFTPSETSKFEKYLQECMEKGNYFRIYELHELVSQISTVGGRFISESLKKEFLENLMSYECD